MKNVSFKIPTMRSSHCQTNVLNTVMKHEDVQVLQQTEGELILALPDNISEKELVDTIEKTGYKVETISRQEEDPGVYQTYSYNTDIKCSGCVARVTPHLDNLPGINQWTVDTNDPDKVLKVTVKGISSEQIIDTVQKAGFRINTINQKS